MCSYKRDVIMRVMDNFLFFNLRVPGENDFEGFLVEGGASLWISH